MGTTLDAIAVETRGRDLPVRAATAAIASAGLVPADIDLLLNAGLYHDDNLGEPALAAILQEDIGANPEDPHEGGHGTFSFDVANGTCGALTAMQIADNFLRAGTIRRALLIAGDSRPGRRIAPHFPFTPTGAALVLGWDDRSPGFGGFVWETDPDGDELFEATVAFDGRRNVLRITEDPEYVDRAVLWATKAAARLLADTAVTADTVDLVVAAPLGPRFLSGLAGGLGIDRPCVAQPDSPGAATTHTAALLVALEAARRSGQLARARTVLFVAAGAGTTAGAALLHRIGGTPP